MYVCMTEMMAADQDRAWQDNKTLHERNHYMLEHEIATNVCFEFRTPEAGVKLVRAHTYMLIASSPVFEAMFCGGMSEAGADRNNIQIPDIDAETFKEMLRFDCYLCVLCPMGLFTLCDLSTIIIIIISLLWVA